ncbi:MAG: major membrane immunogen (membrane-anchored lipoprotein), partial [Flavobacteriaceae bacterium]
MKKLNYFAAIALAVSVLFVSCEQSDETEVAVTEVSAATLQALTDAGFDVDNIAPIQFEDGVLVEGDIYIPFHDLSSLRKGDRLPVE